MSAVAISFDPTFTLGHRSHFTWPGPLESGNSSDSASNRDTFSIGSHLSDSPVLASSTRSVTASPPQFHLNPEQRQLKRQQNRARRDSRLNTRMKRENSNTSFFDSPPPMALPDGSTGAMDMPHYSAAPAHLSMLSESLPTGHYMSSYSPPLPEHQPGAPMFPTPYQQPLPGGYPISLDYSTSYSSPTQFTDRSSPTLPVGHDSGMMYQMPAVMPSGGGAGVTQPEGGHVRVVQSRPKPRCWEHGCNGRQFSTFSNLLRHQREKSGQSSKASCPNCGAEFTRTTARNGHMLHDKCKQRRNS